MTKPRRVTDEQRAQAQQLVDEVRQEHPEPESERRPGIRGRSGDGAQEPTSEAGSGERPETTGS